MKRNCLLSQHYTGSPMLFKGQEIHYSSIVNEILREFKVAVFFGATDQTEFSGICEGIMVMSLLAKNDLARIDELRKMERADRHREVLTFSLANEEEIERITPQLTARLESALASSVESEAGGKSHSPHLDSSLA